MNDLNKRELQEIYRCLQYMISGGTTPYSCLTIDIKNKINSMIQNYCEHHHTILETSHVNQFRCKKCKKVTDCDSPNNRL